MVESSDSPKQLEQRKSGSSGVNLAGMAARSFMASSMVQSSADADRTKKEPSVAADKNPVLVTFLPSEEPGNMAKDEKDSDMMRSID